MRLTAIGGGVVSVEAAQAAVLDGYGETALLEAIRLSHAGELATCAYTMDKRDAEALASVFRAIGAQLEGVEQWIDAVRSELLAVQRSSVSDTPHEVGSSPPA